MIIAKLDNVTHVVASDGSLNRSSPMYCPSCGQRVYLKKGKLKIAHFAHFSKQECESFSEGETAEHLKGKWKLFHSLKKQGYEVALEAYLPELKQRPDILLKTDTESIAIEYQCSMLPIDKMVERTENYLRNGYYPYWILGEKFVMNQNITTLKKTFIQHTTRLGFYFVHFNSGTNELKIFYDFYKVSDSKWRYTNCRIPLEALDLMLNKNFKELISKKTIKKPKESLYRSYLELQNKIRASNNRLRPFIFTLYRHSETIVTMPIELFLSLKNEWLIEQPPYEWKYHFLRWIESQNKRKIITKRNIISYIKNAINSQELQIARLPLVKDEVIVSLFVDYLSLLINTGIVIKISDEKWLFQSKAARYSNESDKVKRLKNLFF
ncbi:competence protein CoiA [Marinilactibacillus kalidii]|uniref:competence protein CoiA n=1 Tax=Marinilactibacillus kalidii TaxID=2820274 RepID=UPI001ABE4E8A|nr:competence protein CoiA family protein [Marinilactibacillus kalidii]